MKKIVLSLAGVMAAIAFAPEAAAVPVFARQTGMACSACHFQHFPLLNGFGRAFKSAGFTMMGAQGKVETAEGEHGATLSIPNNLNFGVLTTTGYETVSGATTNTGGGNAAWFVPASGGELSLFMGGRIAEFAGFLTETGLGAAAKTGAAKLALLFPVGDMRVGVVAHTSNGQGVAYSYETLNTGAVNTHKMTALNGNNQGALVTNANGGHTGVYSASQYLMTNTAATGLSLVAVNDSLGFINIGKYDIAGVGVATAGALPLTYVRVAGLFEAAGFDMGAGIQSFSGTSKAVLNTEVKATVIDFQAQGEVSGMGLGVYASYGSAPAAAVGTLSALNPLSLSKRSSFNIGAELGVIPHTATLQLGLRSGKNGGAAGADGDNAFLIGGTYELAQNVELSLTHSSQSGSAWNGVGVIGKSVTSLMMEALF
ncbi:MAG: hypothetical protein PHI11_02610 [Gallionella sp.]|nr:hypothetical protein [Gallionella sp.]